jgi:hypothetical protein
MAAARWCLGLTSYVEAGKAPYDQKYKQSKFSYTRKQALALGYELVPIS